MSGGDETLIDIEQQKEKDLRITLNNDSTYDNKQTIEVVQRGGKISVDKSRNKYRISILGTLLPLVDLFT